ncbi:polysaccharide deacetylase family protein [Roseimaritima sediminicola]|uniref:polysaccharide deacetylase family protein n=1 Tax=Roseimaritima sediminicola TaxID=2662066 RepID=UPI0013870FC8|nr:polysaccharide deacetylase family protein [Roseimaritima sediminicola]
MLRTLDQARLGRAGDLAVLTYHRVDEPEARSRLYPGLISASPERFGQQLDLLTQIAQVVSMQEVLEACAGRAMLPARCVLITFDDACCDFARHAWPELKRRGLPATLFVPTAYPDRPDRHFWWDRLYAMLWHGGRDRLQCEAGRFDLTSDRQRKLAYRSLSDWIKAMPHDAALRLLDQMAAEQAAPLPPHNVLSWQTLRQLAQEGVTLAAHTQTHPLLTRVDLEEARREVSGSQADLQREIGQVLPVFAYPGGQHNAALVRMMREEGFELAFTVRRGINHIPALASGSRERRLTMNRINIGQQTSVQVLHAQLIALWCHGRTRGRV